MKLITIALAILLVAALCIAQQIPGAFDTPLPVKAGEGSTSYEFTLPSDEWFRVDFVNPDTDFTFIVGNGGSTNPIPSLASPRDTPLKFLTLTLSNDTIVNAGVVLRWRYSSVAVEPTTMEFVIVRGNTRWWEFDHYSELDAPTQIIAQSLPSTELNAGTNMIGIFGGNPVTLPDEGDPRYQVFGTSYTAEAAVSNKYEYKLDRKQIFHLEFINPSNEFSFTVNRTASNPGSDLTTGLKGIYFFDISINSAQQPGPDGLRYGSVLTFQYPVGIPENIVEETLNFLIYDGSSWKSFSQESERSSYTKYVTQPTNVYLEFSSLHLQVALVAQQKSVDPEPEESPETSVAPVQSSQKPTPSTPTGSASGKPSEDPRTSGPQDSDVLGSSASSVQVKIVTFLLAALAIALMM